MLQDDDYFFPQVLMVALPHSLGISIDKVIIQAQQTDRTTGKFITSFKEEFVFV